MTRRITSTSRVRNVVVLAAAATLASCGSPGGAESTVATLMEFSPPAEAEATACPAVITDVRARCFLVAGEGSAEGLAVAVAAQLVELGGTADPIDCPEMSPYPACTQRIEASDGSVAVATAELSRGEIELVVTPQLQVGEY